MRTLASYVSAFVEHFRGRVDHIVIWNEPNLSLEWGYRPVDPEGYTDLLRAVYPRAKAADPDVVVLGGALAPTLAPAGDPEGMNDLDYLRADAGRRRGRGHGWPGRPRLWLAACRPTPRPTRR